MYLFTTLHIPLQRVLKLFFFFLHRVTNFISLHQDTTTTLFKIKKISYLVFAMYKWSQTSKKNQPDLLNHYISWENKPRFLPRFMPHLIQNQSHKVPVVSAFSTILENCVKKLISFYISSFFKID